MGIGNGGKGGKYAVSRCHGRTQRDKIQDYKQTKRHPPKTHTAPTNRAKSDQEEAIQRALEKRDHENTSFDDLALEFGIPTTIL